jgi:hypothetical protein
MLFVLQKSLKNRARISFLDDILTLVKKFQPETAISLKSYKKDFFDEFFWLEPKEHRRQCRAKNLANK